MRENWASQVESNPFEGLALRLVDRHRKCQPDWKLQTFQREGEIIIRGERNSRNETCLSLHSTADYFGLKYRLPNFDQLDVLIYLQAVPVELPDNHTRSVNQALFRVEVPNQHDDCSYFECQVMRRKA